MGDLSPHFSKSEFRDHSDNSLPKGMPVKKLIDALEKLRSICGNKPLVIVSGYRSPAHNKAVGGALHSKHLTGEAADVEPGYCTLKQAEEAGFTGIGINPDHEVIHVDVRSGSLVVFHDNW